MIIEFENQTVYNGQSWIFFSPNKSKGKQKKFKNPDNKEKFFCSRDQWRDQEEDHPYPLAVWYILKETTKLKVRNLYLTEKIMFLNVYDV